MFIVFGLGLFLKESVLVVMVGGVDGLMVLFILFVLVKYLFVFIMVVVYFYLGLIYGGYFYLVKLLIFKCLCVIKMVEKKVFKNYDVKVKLVFFVILCVVLCFLFLVVLLLFFLLFLGVVVCEFGMKYIYDFVSGLLFYGFIFMLGLLLGVFCDVYLLFDLKIFKLLVLGMFVLLLLGIGGIMGGYIMYFIKKGNYNLVIGIVVVSCVFIMVKVV